MSMSWIVEAYRSAAFRALSRAQSLTFESGERRAGFPSKTSVHGNEDVGWSWVIHAAGYHTATTRFPPFTLHRNTRCVAKLINHTIGHMKACPWESNSS